MSNNKKNSKCFAPGCTSGYANNSEKVSLFKAPRNPDIREKWNSIISRADRNLQANDVICEKHFNPEDIIKSIVINDIIIPYKRPRLKKNAIPKLFPNCPTYLAKNTKKRIINDGIEFINVIEENGCTSENQELIVNENEVQNCENMQDNSDLFLKLYNKVENEVQNCENMQDNSDLFLKLYNKVENEVQNCENMQDNSDWFLKLYNKDEILSLNEYWGTFSCEKNNIKYLLYSQMNVKNNTPVMGKQIIIYNNLEVTFFCGSNQITDNMPALVNTKADLETSINLFSKLFFCPGGPSSNMYEDIVNITECAYIDYSSASWRHKKCPITMTSENLNLCEYCNCLWSRFNRNRLSKNKNRIRVRRKGLGLKFANKAMKKNAVEKYKLKTKINNLEEKFKKVTEAD